MSAKFAAVRALRAFVPTIVLAVGCSTGPAAILPPSIDAEDAGAKAMEIYDKDGDGVLVGAELDGAPALKAAMATLDADKDGKVTAAEVAARVARWQASRGGITGTTCYVTLNGEPVEGATVAFEPEPFLGDQIERAAGVTNFQGAAAPTIAKEDRPTPQTPPGLRLGFYKVRISKQEGGKELIPPVYNVETTLGHEIAADDPDMIKHRIDFKLVK